MITLNFTFFVQLGLFLVFLWATHRFILRPTLRTMDQREAERKREAEATQQDEEAAEGLENAYAEQLRVFRRRQSQRAEKARRAAQEKHMADLAAHRREADGHVAQAREGAQAELAKERGKLGALAPDLADAIAARLGLKGGRQ
ncbi:MAG TPA: hypothetical protein HPP77_02405 [Candidatus Hydrogenedentes bacterium]|nr:hypothetical protein [Candidatus Hydrogenedentota bacterium]HIJ74128.1 hypothetical protein [Candidatus Hydrogenedentota bacterium]